MNHLRIALLIFIFLQNTGVAWGYEPPTHEEMAENAVETSSLAKNPELLKDLGLKPLASKQVFPNYKGDEHTVIQLFRDGARFEDNDDRPLNHFYDPQNQGRPLTVLPLVPQNNSPDWALEDVGDIGAQEFSFKDARESLYQALTLPTKAERDEQFGKAFQTLGQVIHHVQDMAQPQHVRNDDHCDTLLCRIFFPAHKPSAYEAHVAKPDTALTFAGYNSGAPVTFQTARGFWVDSGKGIAEFTSNNFVSAGTNFGGALTDIQPHPEYSLPSAANVAIDKKNIEDPELLGPDQPLRGIIQFIGTPVVDNYTGGSPQLNPRTSTYSIFDADLKKYNLVVSYKKYTTRAIFSLNRFNFDKAHEFLIPRAVAYSAGLIDYFFRGSMEITLPDEGIYGIIDHATTNQIDQGFTKIKLKLKNTTLPIAVPGGDPIPQDMTGGTLVAVAKYHRNGCYQPDLSGELTESATLPSGCRIFPNPNNPTEPAYLGGEEAISVSEEIAIQELGSTAPTLFTFDFSKNAIPINARDLYLQVVYRGKLGSEDDAVVVATKDISEPTYISFLNSTDYFWMDGQYRTPQEIEQNPVLRDQFKDEQFGLDSRSRPWIGIIYPEPVLTLQVKFSDTNLIDAPYVTHIAILPEKQFTRIAVLVDIGQFDIAFKRRFESLGWDLFSDSTERLVAAENQLDKETGIFYFKWISEIRGLYYFNNITHIKAYSLLDLPSGGELAGLSKLTGTGPTPLQLNFQ